VASGGGRNGALLANGGGGRGGSLVAPGFQNQ
jgi:hypothetical protein